MRRRCLMNIEMFIKEKSKYIRKGQRTVEIAPDFDQKHINILQEKYKLDKDVFKYILVMSYTSTGCLLFTGNTVYYDNFMDGGLKCIPFSSICGVSAVEGKTFSSDKLYITTTNSKILLDGSIDGLNLATLTEIFNFVASKNKDGNVVFTISKQGILTSQLPQNIKLLYLKILCNYAYLDDALIDANEYNVLTKISVRIELDGSTRAILRAYMNDAEHRTKTGNLLLELEHLIENESGCQDAVRYCLMQDVLYLHEQRMKDAPWQNDGFIGSLKDYFNLEISQIDTMQKAVSLNRIIEKKDADIAKSKDEWRKFVKSISGTPAYVPTLYLFCSGSIYGMKTYMGFLKRDETSQKAINKQRELILQELIANNQKTVNVLIGDMNHLATRLEKALEEEDRIKSNYKNIQQLLIQIKLAMNSVQEEDECEKTLSESKRSGD